MCPNTAYATSWAKVAHSGMGGHRAKHKAPWVHRLRRYAAVCGVDRVDRGEAAKSLLDHLLTLYATGELSAKALSIAAYWAVKAGVKNVELSQYAQPPGRQSGYYSTNLKRRLPSQAAAKELNVISMPAFVANRRTKKAVPVSPAFDVLNGEYDKLIAGGTVLEPPTESDWAPMFRQHPYLVIPGDSRPVFPVAVYVDGIRYTRPTGISSSDDQQQWFSNGCCFGNDDDYVYEQ